MIETDKSDIRVLAFLKYGDRAASTRQRLLQYLPYLAARGIRVHVSTLLDNDYVRRVGQAGGRVSSATIRAYLTRAADLITAGRYDLIWIYSELFPYLPGFFERLAFVGAKPVIYDFDDAIFHQYDTHASALVRTFLGRKLQPLLRRADACLCGNDYLRDYAARFCRCSSLMPTVVDTDVFRPAAHRTDTETVTIGWIGSPSTWSYVRPLLPLLERVCQTHPARFRVIGAGTTVEAPFVENLEWSEQTEVAQLQGIDIGIMPLLDDPWARGKCGYKLIQYMACGSAVVASPVGVNSHIVEHGVNGLLARDDAEWEAALAELIRSADVRRRMGERGRAKIVAEYSLQTHAPRLERLIRGAHGGTEAA